MLGALAGEVRAKVIYAGRGRHPAMRLLLVQPRLGASPDADNLEIIRGLVRSSATPLADDVLLLPEHVVPGGPADAYERAVGDLARTLGCHVVGGSHHQLEGSVNAGVACDPGGAVVGRYEKVRPYAGERERVQPGRCVGEIAIAGRRILVLLCADFWFADVILGATTLPDVVLVPALSVTRKPTPEYSRALWRHLAVSRAYEYGVYVGISDWAHESELPLLPAAGVAGFADPTGTDPEKLFQPLGASALAAHELHFDRLEDFRRDRRSRGFFWKG
ncbi:MAG: carbon-nitrogen hydrolase family protein [Deltaproteobacteria bacterium]|nr:MAG: carbon-nitrogen hydrolase family protein [Deltaproteobacteria bacterium]